MTISATENKTRPTLNQFIIEMASDGYCLRLLRFFGLHPSSRFNKLAIIHAVDENGSKLNVEKALSQLIDERVVKINIENDISLYLLTRDEPIRHMVLELAELDWLQAQVLLGH